MTRTQLYNLLKTIYPTHWIGQKQGKCKSPYLVIRFKNQSKSLNNGIAGWQYFEVMVYVPNTSTLALDTGLAKVKEVLQGVAEPTGNITPDYLDEEVSAYMRSIEYRIPKRIINE